MKFRQLILSALSCSLSAVLLSGCNVAELGTDNMLRPPASVGDEAEITQLIASVADKNYTLKYPKNGSNRSAITMYDLNGDNVEEAVAFYQNNDDVTHIHMLVMYSDSNGWNISSDNPVEAADIDCLEFSNVSENSSVDILAGFSTLVANINTLTCFSYSDGVTTTVEAGQNYSGFSCCDINGDNYSEIITFQLGATDYPASASLIDYNTAQNKLYVKDTVPMDPNAVKFKSISSARLDENTSGIVLDGITTTEEFNTQIIYYDNLKLKLINPLYNEKVNNFTKRNLNVISADVDNDGFIEIPQVRQFKSDNELKKPADEIIWYNFMPTSNQPVEKCRMAANSFYSYSFIEPESWTSDSITVINNSENNSMEFFEWIDNKLGGKLFEIKTFDISVWELGRYTDTHTLILKNEKYAFAFSNENTDSKLALSDSEIKSGFLIMNENTV